ncbi:MAG: hypothetical protein SGCHY_003035 [Lobulomycetales sp.]
MPTNWVLKQLAFPPPVNAFKPGETLDGRQTPPRISYRNQERIRRACAMADIDPESIGLPSRMARAREMSDQERQSSQVLHKMQISKSTKKIIAQAERRKKIEENMERMDERVRSWKEEKAKIRQKSRPTIPF